MTSRERMTAALKKEGTDRVPFFPCIAMDHGCVAAGRRYEEALADPRNGVRWMFEADMIYGSDAVRVMTTPPRSWFEEKEVRPVGDHLAQVDLRTGVVDGFFDVQGGGALILKNPPEPVTTLAQAQQIRWPSADELIAAGCLDAAREVAEAAHRKDKFVVGMAGGQTINFLVEQVGDSRRALMAMADDPEFTHAVFDAATAASLEVIAAFARVGVDAVYIGDSYASGSVISPRMYREYCMPRYRRAAETAHRLGLLVYKHCCGSYNPLLPLLAVESYLDGMEGMDPTNGMTVARTLSETGGNLCLIGGVSCLTLLQGTPDKVYEESRACVRQGGAEGRYVLGSACAVPRYAPVENMRAFARAALNG